MSRERGISVDSALRIARLIARCVSDDELFLGEICFLALANLQSTVQLGARSRGMTTDVIDQANRRELDGVRKDMDRLISYVEATGEGWLDPELGSPLDHRNDRGWEDLLRASGIPTASLGEHRERWQRIHEAIRLAGGRVYPPELFDPLSS